MNTNTTNMTVISAKEWKSILLKFMIGTSISRKCQDALLPALSKIKDNTKEKRKSYLAPLLLEAVEWLQGLA